MHKIFLCASCTKFLGGLDKSGRVWYNFRVVLKRADPYGAPQDPLYGFFNWLFHFHFFQNFPKISCGIRKRAPKPALSDRTSSYRFFPLVVSFPLLSHYPKSKLKQGHPERRPRNPLTHSHTINQ